MSNEANANASAETLQRLREVWADVLDHGWRIGIRLPSGQMLAAWSFPLRKDSIAAALAFTDARLEEVRQIEEEIAWLKSLQHVTHMNAAIRVLQSRERELATARRGLRQNSERSTEDV